jgi:hypothetical protein
MDVFVARSSGRSGSACPTRARPDPAATVSVSNGSIRSGAMAPADADPTWIHAIEARGIDTHRQALGRLSPASAPADVGGYPETASEFTRPPSPGPRGSPDMDRRGPASLRVGGPESR